jgi:CheY-like chemotaxis protein/DNA-binding CsgD family transcriptional regulator
MATILVVDDDADIRLLTKLNFELDGHQVRLAGDAKAAMASVATERPDVIVLDVMMPEVDGFTVLTQLKASPGDIADIPVLMLTALSGHLDRAKGGIEGAVRYLTKPIDLDELREAVQEALEGVERSMRLDAQRGALELLARIEGKADDPEEGSHAPRPRLSAFEIDRRPTPARAPASLRGAIERLPSLTEKQRGLLDELAASSTVMGAADVLGVSRSNVYASLRRISRKLGTRNVPELLDLLRTSQLV